MGSSGVMTWLRRATLALGILCGVWIAAPARVSGVSPDGAEVRALWVTRSSLTSPASITSLVKAAADAKASTA